MTKRRNLAFWLSALVLLMSAQLVSAQKVLFTETFDALTEGKNDTKMYIKTAWTGNDQVENVTKCYQAGQAVLVGNYGNGVGSFELKALDLSGANGVFTVKVRFKGAHSQAPAGTLKISVDGDEASAKTEIANTNWKDAWVEKEFTFTNGKANSKIKFETLNGSTNQKSVFIDNIEVSQAAAAAPALFTETFDALEKGKNTSKDYTATKWQGNDQIKEVKYCYEAGKAVLVGNYGNNVGSFELKELDLSKANGVFTVKVKFKGAAAKAPAGTLKISVDGDEASAQQEIANTNWKDEWVVKEFTFTNGKKDSKIKIETLNGASNQKAVFIDNIEVYQETSSVPVLLADKDALAFGRVLLNQESKLSLTLTAFNLKEDLKASLDKEDQGFSVATKDLTALKNGGKLEIAYKPTAAGMNAAKLTISAGDKKVEINLTGEGVDPENVYGFDTTAEPIQPFANIVIKDKTAITEGFRNIAKEGSYAWDFKLYMDEGYCLHMNPAGSGQKIVASIVSPLVVIKKYYTYALYVHYRATAGDGTTIVVKQIAADGKTVIKETTHKLEQGDPLLPNQFVRLPVEVTKNKGNSFFVIEYQGDDTPTEATDKKIAEIFVKDIHLFALSDLEPAIAADATTLNFGKLAAGKSAKKSFNITSKDMDEVKEDKIILTIEGDNADQYTLSVNELPIKGGAVEVTCTAKEISDKKGEGKDYTTSAKVVASCGAYTAEVALTTDVLTSIEEINALGVVAIDATGVNVLAPANVVIYNAAGEMLQGGNFSAGERLEAAGLGSVIVVVNGVATKTNF